ncbi:MAG: GAF domain-containing protein [Hydrogenothermaceae bacterium]|nr:GAF domain-containing protein [Hydrogenothermaceae bacterium]
MTERNQLLALYEITKTLTSSMNYGKNLRYVVNLLQSYTDFENILIVLNSIDNNEIVEISTYKDLTYKKGEGIIGKVWKHGIPIVIPDVSEEKEFLNKIKRDLKIYKNGKLAFIAVPIKTESDILGVLAADKFHRDDESLDYSLRFLTMVANLLGSSIKLFLELQKEKLKLEEEKNY